MSGIVQSVGTAPAGGISQQPAAQRLPGQVTDATNVVFDAGFGFSKRPGTQFDRAFTATAGADVRHAIWTYNDEKYIIVWGKINSGAMTVRAFRVGGNECAITFDSGTTTYIGSSSATGSDLLMRPVGDDMLFVNTKVSTALTTTTSFTPERHFPTYRDMVCYTTTTDYYIQTDADDASADAGYYQYTPGTYKYSIINFPTITNPWSIHNGYWDDNNYGNCAGFRIAFRRVALTGFTAATWTAATKTLTKTGAFTNYTWRSGDMIYLSAGTGHTVGWYTIASRSSNDAIVLASATGLSGADNADTAANVTSATYGETNICRIGREVEVVLDFKAMTDITSMHDIAYKITQALRNQGAENACCVWVPQTAGGAFQITGPWRGNNGVTYLPSTPVTTAPTLATNGDLTASGGPFNSTNAQVYAGSGGAAADASDTASPESRWTRTSAPGQSNGKLDATTMPVKLARTAANTFTMSVPSWTPRTAGDSSSNPGPRLFTTGQKISDAVWHKNRLFLCGGPHVAGSTVGKGSTAGGLDFFVADPGNVVDSDPIDKTLPGEDQGGSKYLAGFRDSVVVFCQRGQFEIGSGDQVLSPSTASITPSTRYNVAGVRPVAGTTQLYFLTDRGNYSSLLEYYHDELRVASEASDVTAHVPRLVPSSCRSMTVSVPGRTVLVLPDDAYTAYCYRWLFDNGQKLQSAWTRFTFDGNYRILDVASDGSMIWFIVENTGTVTYTASASPTTITFAAHGLSNGDSVTFDNATDSALNGTWTVSNVTADTFTVAVTTTTSGTARMCLGQYVEEKMSLERPEATTSWAYPIHMDRQITLTGSHAAGTTTFTLPATPTVLTGSSQFVGKGSTLNTIVLGPAFTSSSGNVVSIASYTSTTVTATGNYSAGSAVLGRYFEIDVDLTRPFVRDGRGRADIGGRMAVAGVSASYEDTCAFTIQAYRATGSVTTRTRSVDNSNTPTDGQFRTLLDGDPERVEWTIKDTSSSTAPKPVNITQVSHDVEYSPSLGQGVLGGAN